MSLVFRQSYQVGVSSLSLAVSAAAGDSSASQQWFFKPSEVPQSSRPQHVPRRPGPQRGSFKTQTCISGLDSIPLYFKARCNLSAICLNLVF